MATKMTREDILKWERHLVGYFPATAAPELHALCTLALSAISGPQDAPVACRHEAYLGRCVHCNSPYINGFASPPAAHLSAQPTKCLYGESIGMPDHACQIGCDYDEAEIASRIKSAQREVLEDERWVAALKDKLSKVSKGEPHTWGFVAMFMQMIDEVASERRSLLPSAGSEG